MLNKLNNLNKSVKTLKFALIPSDNTLKNLVESDQINKDKYILSVYQELVKPKYDKMHEDFITESLSNVVLPSKELEEFYNYYKSNYNLKPKPDLYEEAIKNYIKDLKPYILKSYDSTVIKWCEQIPELKVKDGIKILTTKQSLIKIQEYCTEEEYIKLMKTFEKFFTYLSGFNVNRMNYYSSDKENTVIFRTLEQNLIRYMNNLISLDKVNNELNKLDILNLDISSIDIKEFNKYINQQGIDGYNKIVGDFNSQINKINQDNFSQNEKKSNTKLPKLQFLYKQIGSLDKNQNSLGYLIFEPNEIYKRVLELKNNQASFINKANQVIKNLLNDESQLDKIFLNKKAITTISSKLFLSWDTLGGRVLKIKLDKKSETYKTPKFISFNELKTKLEAIPIEELPSIFKGYQNSSINSRELHNGWIFFKKSFDLITSQIISNALAEQAVNNFKYDIKTAKGIVELKQMCDAFLEVDRLVSYFEVPEEMSGEISEEIKELLASFSPFALEKNLIVSYYNAFRAVATRKISDLANKPVKLNFNSSSFLSSFGNDFGTNEAMIVKNNDKYHLLIVNGTKIDKEAVKLLTKSDSLSKYMQIEFIKPDAKNLSRMFYKSKGDDYGPNADQEYLQKTYVVEGQSYTVEEIIIQKLFSTSKKDSYKPFLKIVIDYYFNCLRKSPSFAKFNLQFEYNDKINNLNDFCSALEEQCYNLNWRSLDWDLVEQYVTEGKFSLFQIQSKDFNVGTTGKLNKQTYYFLKSLDSNSGTKCRIAGNGKILYREASDIKLNDSSLKNPKYRMNRYLQDRYELQFPIIIGNYEELAFNKKVNSLIKLEKEINCIGIDRGEKNLAYYTVVGKNGEIIEQGSLDVIVGAGDKPKNYNELLTTKASNMMEARQNWKTIGKIKDLKEGYLSQVVHQIQSKMIEHNAVIALENLNLGFMANRSAKVEKSLYKKFEKLLATSLSNVVIKDHALDDSKIGSIINPYNLTPIMDEAKFSKSNQWGTMFYIKAAYTSQVDPVTGWRKTNLTDNLIKEMVDDNTFKVVYITDRKCFGINYTVTNDNISKTWTLEFSKNISRIKATKQPNSKYTYNEINLFDEFENYLSDINLFNSRDLELINETMINSDKALKGISYLFRLASRIRNSDSSKNIDRISSAVWSNKINGYFNSDNSKKYKEEYEIITPQDADANGSYNIARKGLMIINRIKNNDTEKPIDYMISDTQWDKYLIDNS